MLTEAKLFGLTPEEREFYSENGFVAARGVFTREEAAYLRSEAHLLAERLQASGDRRARFTGWGAAGKVTQLPRELIHCHNPQYHSAAFARLIVDPRLTDRAADLIGPNVQLHHTKLFIKPPETGAPFPMHQDSPYFPHEKDSMIAAIIHFDDAPVEKGCVRVAPGSHRQGARSHLTDGGHHLPVEQFPVADALPVPAEAGDVLFFSYLTIHGSGVNTSSESRTTLLVQMRDPTDHPLVWHGDSMFQKVPLDRSDKADSAGLGPLKGARPALFRSTKSWPIPFWGLWEAIASLEALEFRTIKSP